MKVKTVKLVIRERVFVGRYKNGKPKYAVKAAEWPGIFKITGTKRVRNVNTGKYITVATGPSPRGYPLQKIPGFKKEFEVRGYKELMALAKLW